MASRISQVRFKRSVVQDLRGIRGAVDQQLASLSRILLSNPEAGERLRGPKVPLRRLRFGDCRVTYAVRDGHVWVLLIVRHGWGSEPLG